MFCSNRIKTTIERGVDFIPSGGIVEARTVCGEDCRRFRRKIQ